MNENAACSYKKRHKFIRDKRISLFLRQGGKTGRKEEDKAEQLRGKKREKRTQERGKGNGLLVHPTTGELYLEIRKKAEHGRIPTIREDYLVSEIRG